MSKTLTRRRPKIDDDYLHLIEELPLRPIRNEKDHAVAQRILDRLMGKADLTAGQRDYLAGLVRFVEEYERERYGEQFKRMKPVDIIRFLMEQNDLNTADLGYIVGSRGLASEILNGNRALSKRLILRLADRFKLDPALFLLE